MQKKIKKSVQFVGHPTTTTLFFNYPFATIKTLAEGRKIILLTDENLHKHHPEKFSIFPTIVIPAGEKYKTLATAEIIFEELIRHEADRKTLLIGIGGGVVTDLTGFVAAVYMRGIAFGFLPTSLLAMVDASIGGKNGVDFGHYKNIVGTTRQPQFLLYDFDFLSTLPVPEWSNGFAEIIKHACIQDKAMFDELEKNNIEFYQNHASALEDLIYTNLLIKLNIVVADELEQGDRKLLNFGHTLGHALENLYNLSHGEAIAIGMTYAAYFSQDLLNAANMSAVVSLFKQYGLPNFLDFDPTTVFDILKMDKKRKSAEMQYILLEKIGKGIVVPLPLNAVEQLLKKTYIKN